MSLSALKTYVTKSNSTDAQSKSLFCTFLELSYEQIAFNMHVALSTAAKFSSVYPHNWLQSKVGLRDSLMGFTT